MRLTSSEVTELRRRLLSAAVRHTRCQDDAEDLVQEVLLKVALEGSFRAESGLYTWAYRVLVNQAIDDYRRYRRRVAVSLEERRPDGERPALELPDPGPGPEGLAIATSLRRDLAKALGLLCPAYREAFDLHVLGGLSLEDTAVRLGCPIGTVRSRVHRARRAIAGHLAGHLCWAVDAGGLDQ